MFVTYFLIYKVCVCFQEIEYTHILALITMVIWGHNIDNMVQVAVKNYAIIKMSTMFILKTQTHLFIKHLLCLMFVFISLYHFIKL